jgi:hypothetical protein
MPLQVTSTATLTSGTAPDQQTSTSSTSVTLTVTNCDVQPSIRIDQPNLQTSLVYQWSQALTALSPAAMSIPWGGSAAVQASAVFTRTVTSASFLASFTLTLTNPVPGPIAVTNLQLACPWGGNTLLPCGAAASGGIGIAGASFGTNQLLVIPSQGSVQCNINNLQIAATWGNDFTQPCTILTSNWLGTQTSLTGVVLDFSAPTRWQLINNCASWTVTCSQPMGNPFYNPVVGGLPSGRQVGRMHFVCVCVCVCVLIRDGWVCSGSKCDETLWNAVNFQSAFGAFLAVYAGGDVGAFWPGVPYICCFL